MPRSALSGAPSPTSSPAPVTGEALRIAVVGIGAAATLAHLPALQAVGLRRPIDVVGICDRAPRRRVAAAGADRLVPGFDDNAAMLDAVHPDLLVIATPPSAHLDEISAAVTRGIHVLCEKPVGLRVTDVQMLRSLVSGHPDVVVATVHQYRFAPAWAWMARAATGALRDGESFTIEVAVERPGTDPLSDGGWRSHPESEGGILGDHAVHYMSLLKLLEPATTVVGCRREGDGGRETAVVDLRLGAAGTARIHVSYAGDVRRNVVSLSRPAQCLDITWDGPRVGLRHNGVPSPLRTVGSLSDRDFVNALYQPMYERVATGLADAWWRGVETGHTVAVAEMLSTALSTAEKHR
jgi:predicted dehydrogenase